MSNNILTVGIGEYKIAKSPYILKCILGSCVGVIIYDKINRIGGLAHVYLPASDQYKSNYGEDGKTHKYADILLPLMIKDIIKKNANIKYLMSYITGGATLFYTKPNPLVNIGKKNLDAVRQILKTKNITFFELQVGGNTGRKVIFDLKNGDIEIIPLKKIG